MRYNVIPHLGNFTLSLGAAAVKENFGTEHFGQRSLFVSPKPLKMAALRSSLATRPWDFPFQDLKPVEHNVDLRGGRLLARLEHHEPLAVGRDRRSQGS